MVFLTKITEWIVGFGVKKIAVALGGVIVSTVVMYVLNVYHTNLTENIQKTQIIAEKDSEIKSLKEKINRVESQSKRDIEYVLQISEQKEQRNIQLERQLAILSQVSQEIKDAPASPMVRSIITMIRQNEITTLASNSTGE